MKLSLASAEHWVSAHPTESVVIGLGGLLAVLWLLGVFKGGGSADAAATGASNLAGAFYAAEAQQAVVGGQIQMTTLQTAAATAQAANAANAAVAINEANAHAATIINGQNTGAASIMNQSSNDAAVAMSGNQLLATYSNNDAAVRTTALNTSAAVAVNASNNNANVLATAMQTVVPQELAAGGTGAAIVTLPGGQQIRLESGAAWNLASLEAQGYSADQAAQIAGVR